MITQSTVGRTTVGASWQVMASGPVYLVPVTIPAGLMLSVVAHIRHSVANVPHVGGYLYSDSAGAPGLLLGYTGQTANSVLGTSTGRWFSFPVSRWFDTSTDVWVGLSRVGNTSWDLAFDSTGGEGGTLSVPTEGATWTSGTNDWSIHAVVLT